MSSVVAERPGSRLVVRARELRGGRTLTDVAVRAGIRQDELGKIERGETRAIRFDTLLKLCAAFGVSPGDLFAIEDNAPVAPSPLACVLAGVRAGAVHPHVPARTRRRLADDDVLLDPDKADTLLAREEPARHKRRTHVPATVTSRGDNVARVSAASEDPADLT